MFLRLFASSSLLIVIASSVTGCGSGPARAVPSPKAPEYAPADETKCSVTRSHSSPLIVEWPSTERAKLESLARSGVVSVRYNDCHMKPLTSCKVKASYRYVALTPKHDVLRIRNEDELYASMPVYAASLEGKLKKAGELTVTMTIVGRYEAERSRVSAADLEGDCSEATHVIAAVTSGAFQFATGGTSEASAGVSFMGAGAGGRAESSRETLAQDGDEKACGASAEGASAPPFGCGAFLRLEVEPITKAVAERAKPAPAPTRPAAPAPMPSERPSLAAAAPASASAAGRYKISGTTVSDITTKLTWMRVPEASGMPWKEATAFCAGVTADGGGWRLPKKEELLGIGENLPEGIDRNAFPAATSREKGVTAATVYYWTASPHAVSESMAYAVRFGTMGAQAGVQSRTNKNWVRCVK